MRMEEEDKRIRNVSTDAILNDLTPELMTTSQRPIDVDAAISRNYNLSWRLMYEDLGRFMLSDRSTRLSPVPIP